MDYTLFMADVHARLQRVIEEMMGNEALFEMLETEAATELLNLGIAMAASLVERTGELGDAAAELALLPRLRAIRQTMRALGNWAAGKYANPEDRMILRDKLVEHFRVIFGEDARLPSAESLGEILNRVDDEAMTPHQLILELRGMLGSFMDGGHHA